jgi:hypothetical protein
MQLLLFLEQGELRRDISAANSLCSQQCGSGIDEKIGSSFNEIQDPGTQDG